MTEIAGGARAIAFVHTPNDPQAVVIVARDRRVLRSLRDYRAARSITRFDDASSRREYFQTSDFRQLRRKITARSICFRPAERCRASYLSLITYSSYTQRRIGTENLATCQNSIGRRKRSSANTESP